MPLEIATMARLTEAATAAFGDGFDMDDFLETPVPSLGGLTPKECLLSRNGEQAVMIHIQSFGVIGLQ